MKFHAEINVMPLKALLDPQGKAVSSSMKNIGLPEITNVRIGKHISLEIDANDVRVKVLGTSFYVNTNSENGQGEVILTTGRVAVYYDNNPEKVTILNPGEKAVFSKTEQKIIKTENDEVNYMAFKTKELVFSNTVLSDVVKALNSVYHSNIKLKNTKIASYTLSGNYANLTLDAILKIIQEALPVSINKSTGNVIEISGNEYKK